uniref:SWIM-type domain-containing protein n=1 Tax=Lactuca sativa TaxID=4236 RepID=A0A9R1UNX2_LACSA|nr:hypothetical protein LSAT_V11C800433090 [Lactuca sativa]
MIIVRHRFVHPIFRYLVGNVSIYALEIIFKEFEQIKFLEICGCQLRTSHGLPCAHEQAVYLKNENLIPLDSIHNFWKKFNLDPCIRLEDDDVDVEGQTSNTQLKKQSRSSKFGWVRKLKDIFSPSTTSLQQPTSHKNKVPSGRPRLSTQTRPTVPPTQDPTTQYHRRHSFATSMSDYNGSNQHNTFSFQQPSTFYSNSLMSEFPNEFHPYVTNIEDVEGDGNCGLQAIAVSLGYTQNYWRQIRSDLYNELLEIWGRYSMIFQDDINNVQHSLSFTGFGSAQSEYWLIMPDTGFLIANKYGVIVYFLDKQGSSTCFPLWHGPQDISHHRSIVIVFVYNGHYVKVDLQELHPIPTILSERVAGWEILYNARLNAYIPPNAPRNNCNIHVVNVPDN